jgi:hypothetical protein
MEWEGERQASINKLTEVDSQLEGGVMDRREFFIDLLAAALLMKSSHPSVPGQERGFPATETSLEPSFQLDEEIVRGIPIAATTDQFYDVTLPDGRRLSRHSRAAFYRDSAGRVRIEPIEDGDAESAQTVEKAEGSGPLRPRAD